MIGSTHRHTTDTTPFRLSQQLDDPLQMQQSAKTYLPDKTTLRVHQATVRVTLHSKWPRLWGYRKGIKRLPPNLTIHRLIPSHLTGLAEVAAQQHTGPLEHLPTAASRLDFDTDAATLLPSAGQDAVVA